MTKSVLSQKLLLVFLILIVSNNNLLARDGVDKGYIEKLLDHQRLESADPYHGDSYRSWAQNLLNQGKIITKNAIMERFKELQDMKSETLDNTNNRSLLKVFVSSSMPENLLKVYHQQVTKYGGTLVFKGLPNGSFKELARIVMSISESDKPGSIQIDDESFERFGITSVPAILLIREEDCLDSKYCKVIYDKVVGSVGVRPALEQFAYNGQLSQAASALLESSSGNGP